MNEDHRRLVEHIRRQHPAPSESELTEQSIPLLTDVVSAEALLACEASSRTEESLRRPHRSAPDETPPRPGTFHAAAEAPRGPRVHDEGLEARIVGQALARLQSPTTAAGALLDEAVRSATGRLADRMAAELRHSLQAVLLEQIEPVLREAVQSAVQEAMEHEASRSRPL